MARETPEFEVYNIALCFFDQVAWLSGSLCLQNNINTWLLTTSTTSIFTWCIRGKKLNHPIPEGNTEMQLALPNPRYCAQIKVLSKTPTTMIDSPFILSIYITFSSNIGLVLEVQWMYNKPDRQHQDCHSQAPATSHSTCTPSPLQT